MGVGAELFKGIRNGKKPLYPVMKKAKDEGKLVRFTGKKLIINEEEYISRSPMNEKGCREEQTLRIVSWNFNGLKGKIVDDAFVTYLSQF